MFGCSLALDTYKILNLWTNEISKMDDALYCWGVCVVIKYCNIVVAFIYFISVCRISAHIDRKKRWIWKGIKLEIKIYIQLTQNGKYIHALWNSKTGINTITSEGMRKLATTMLFYCFIAVSVVSYSPLSFSLSLAETYVIWKIQKQTYLETKTLVKIAISVWFKREVNVSYRLQSKWIIRRQIGGNICDDESELGQIDLSTIDPLRTK